MPVAPRWLEFGEEHHPGLLVVVAGPIDGREHSGNRGRMPTFMQAVVYNGVLHYLRAVKVAGTDVSARAGRSKVGQFN
jgi:hypothetical protein